MKHARTDVLGMDFDSEVRVLFARKQGKISSEKGFEQLYLLYARTVHTWARMNAPVAVDDVAQDVWFVFSQRWRTWSFYPDRESEEGRPVLSFLYRTFQFVLKAHRRRLTLMSEPLDYGQISNGHASSKKLMNQVEVGNLLGFATKVCSEQELQILHAKLAGLQATEIAAALGISVSVVDHGFRNVISRLRTELKTGKSKRKSHD